MQSDKSKNTAISRTKPSKPIKLLIKSNQLYGHILDYGCGKGADVQYLNRINGIKCCGYDKYQYPTLPVKESYDIILCTYVLNVINQLNFREDIIKHIFSLTNLDNKIIITTRTSKEINQCAKRSKQINHLDGFITNSGTFQKGFTGEELITFVQTIVNKELFTFEDTSLPSSFSQIIIKKIN